MRHIIVIYNNLNNIYNEKIHPCTDAIVGH